MAGYKILEHFGIDEMEVSQFNLLTKALEIEDNGRTIEDVFAAVAAKEVLMWRWNEPEGQGIIITQVQDVFDTRELFLYFIIGTGFMKLAKKIEQDLFTEARRVGATKLTGEVRRKGLARFYARVIEAKPVFTKYEREVL